MQIVELSRTEDFDRKPYIGKHASHKDYDQVFSSGTRVIDEETGRHVLTFVNLNTHGQYKDPAPLLEALQGMYFGEGYRTQGLKRRSVVIGYQPRLILRRDFCAVATLAMKKPKVHQTLIDFGLHSGEVYKSMLPQLFDKQSQEVHNNVLPEWHYFLRSAKPDLDGLSAHFTSGIANKASALHYHRDSGNFPEANSTMISLARDMDHGSGLLVMPEYRIALQFNGFELLIFNGSQIVHGVTKIKQQHPSAYRYTIVYYALKGMSKCLPMAQELQRIKETAVGRARWKTSEHAEERKAKLLGMHGMDESSAKAKGERKRKFFQTRKREIVK